MHNEIVTIEGLMKRGFLYLEDHDWNSAKKYFNNSLDIDPENSQAYIGMLLAELQFEKESDLLTSEISFADNLHYKKALRFADDDYSQLLQSYNLENIFFRANKLFSTASTEDVEIKDIVKAKELFEKLNGYKNSYELKEECDNIIEQLKAKKTEAKKKFITKIRIVLAIVVGLLIIGFVCVNYENNKTAVEVYQNFLGKEFSGEEEDDNGFYSDYTSNSLNPYKTYFLTTEERSLFFNEDGSVYYTFEKDNTLLCYPTSMSQPKDYHNEYDGTYQSFEVRVTITGRIYLDLAGESYLVLVDDHNIPVSIHNYHDMILD